MKRIVRFLIGAAMLSAAAYPQTTTIGDLPDASSVASTDDFACDQGATTRACTALQIKNFVITYIDTEEELEAVVTDISNLIIEAEIDTEEELEALLTNVTDLLTDNDTITADAANADAIDALTEIAQAIKTAANDTDKLAVFNGSLPGGSAECVQMNSSGQMSVTGSACGSGSGAFSDAADPIVQNSTAKDVQIGDGAGTLTGKLEVGGDADQPQVVIEGHSSQTDSILIIQNDADSEVFSVDNDGTTTIGGATGLIMGDGNSDLDIDANNQNITLGDGGASNYLTVSDGGVMDGVGTGGVAAGFIDDITEIDSSIKSGSDTKLLTGTVTIGECAQYDANGDLIGSGGACAASSPAGSDTYVQYNDGGSSFGAEAAFVYDDASDTLTVGSGAATADGLIQGPGSTYDLHIDVNGEVGTWGDGGTNGVQINDAGIFSTIGNGYIQILDSYYWGAKDVVAYETGGDGCDDAAEVQLNSGPFVYSISCDDSANSIVYGQMTMPDSWNAGTVTFEIVVFHGTTESITYYGDFSAQCRGDGEVPSSTWGTAVAADVEITTANQIEFQTTGDVTATGTCAAGDKLFWRWVMDDTACVANCANTDILGVKMEFEVNEKSS